MTAGAKAEVENPESYASRVPSGLRSLLVPSRLIWLALLGGGLLRFYRFDALSLWVDEGWVVGITRQPWDVVLGLHGAYDNHPPLYFALAKLMGLIAPEVTAGRLVSVVAGTLTLPVMYGLARRMIGEWGGLLATLVVALSPLHIWYSQEARPYALTVLAVSATYLAVAGFRESRGWGWAWLYGAAIAVGLYSSYSAIYALVPQGALLIYLSVVYGKQVWRLWLAGVAGVIAFLPWVPQLVGTLGNLGDRSYLEVSPDRIGNTLLSITGIGGEGSYFWGRSPTAWDRWPELQVIMVVGLVVVCVAGLAALWKRGLFSLLCGICLFAGTVVVCAGLSIASPGYAERTLVSATLGWALIVGAIPFATVARGARGLKWAGISALVVAMFLSLASLWAIYRGGDKQHWREFANDAREVGKSGELEILYPDITGVLFDVYEPHAFDQAMVISDLGSLPDSVRPEAGAGSLWLAYVETAGIENIQEQLAERGYTRVEHKYYWNPMWLDHYEGVGGQ